MICRATPPGFHAEATLPFDSGIGGFRLQVETFVANKKFSNLVLRYRTYQIIGEQLR